MVPVILAMEVIMMTRDGAFFGGALHNVLFGQFEFLATLKFMF